MKAAAFIAAWVFLTGACWEVPGRVYGMVDGDTFDVQLTIFIRHYIDERIRVAGIDTPERKAGKAYQEAKEFTRAWLGDGQVTIYACERDAFGRVLADVWRNGRNLAGELVDAGHAQIWQRRQREIMVLDPEIAH